MESRTRGLEEDLDAIFTRLHGLALKTPRDGWRAVLRHGGVKIGCTRTAVDIVQDECLRPGEADALRTVVEIPGVSASSGVRSLVARSRGLDFNDFVLREDALEVVKGSAGDPDGLNSVEVFRSLANYFGWTVHTPMMHASRRFADGTAMSVKIPVERDGDGWTTRRRMESLVAETSQHVAATENGCRLTLVSVMGRLPSDLPPGVNGKAVVLLWYQTEVKRALRMARLAAVEAAGSTSAPAPCGPARAAAGDAPLPAMHALFFDLLGVAGPDAALAEAASAQEAGGEPLIGPVVRHLAPGLLSEPDFASVLEEAMQACSDLSLRHERMALASAPAQPPPPLPTGPVVDSSACEASASSSDSAGGSEVGGGHANPLAVPGMLEFIQERRGAYESLPAHDLAGRLADDWKALASRDKRRYQREARKRRRLEMSLVAPPPLRALVPREAPPAPPPPAPPPPAPPPAPPQVVWCLGIMPVPVPVPVAVPYPPCASLGQHGSEGSPLSSSAPASPVSSPPPFQPAEC